MIKDQPPIKALVKHLSQPNWGSKHHQNSHYSAQNSNANLHKISKRKTMLIQNVSTHTHNEIWLKAHTSWKQKGGSTQEIKKTKSLP